MENLVPDLETCQRLKELGWPQDPYTTNLGWFYFDSEEDKGFNGWAVVRWVNYSDGSLISEGWNTSELAAPTFQELWDALPSEIEFLVTYPGTRMRPLKVLGEKCIEHVPGIAGIVESTNNLFYLGDDSGDGEKDCTCASAQGVNLAQAAAELWINLRTNGLL